MFLSALLRFPFLKKMEYANVTMLHQTEYLK